MTISTASNTVTEQLTEAGRAIEHDSFAIIDAEAGPHGYTAEQLVRLLTALAAGKSSGFGTATATFRDLADSKARLTATLDGSGNRTAVTVDPT